MSTVTFVWLHRIFPKLKSVSPYGPRGSYDPSIFLAFHFPLNWRRINIFTGRCTTIVIICGQKVRPLQLFFAEPQSR